MSHKHNGPINTFIIPTEKAISEQILKRAMFIYDNIYIPDPRETHLVPNGAIQYKNSKMTIIQSEFGPYTRTPEYEQIFETTFERCSQQIKKGIINVVNIDSPSFPYKTLRHAYQWFAGNDVVMENAVKGNAPWPSADEKEFTKQKKIMRPGIYFGCEVLPGDCPNIFAGYPKPYNFNNVDQERADYLFDLALSRMGRTLKYLLYLNERKYIYPLFVDEAFGGIVKGIYQNNEENRWINPNFCNFEQELSNVINKFIFSEIINPDKLSMLSFADVEKLRGKSWEGLQCVRRKLRTSLSRAFFELRDASSKEIEGFINGKLCEMLENYQKEEVNFYDECKTMGIALSAKIISLPATVTVIHNILLSPGWESLIASGTCAVTGVIGLSADRIANIWKTDKGRKRIPIYGLMKNIPSEIKY